MLHFPVIVGFVLISAICSTSKIKRHLWQIGENASIECCMDANSMTMLEFMDQTSNIIVSTDLKGKTLSQNTNFNLTHIDSTRAIIIFNLTEAGTSICKMPEPFSLILDPSTCSYDRSSHQEELVKGSISQQEELVTENSSQQPDLVTENSTQQQELVTENSSQQQELVTENCPQQQDLVCTYLKDSHWRGCWSTSQQDDCLLENSSKSGWIKTSFIVARNVLYSTMFIHSRMKGMYLYIFPLLLPMVYSGETMFVQSCPSSQLEWSTKADEFLCDTSGGLTYHCIMDTGERLVESCFVPLRISPGKAGCPQVEKHKDNVTYFLNEMSTCPSDNSLCPPENHTGYYTDHLYKYPSCFQKISKRFFTDDISNVSPILPGKDIYDSNGYKKEASQVSVILILLCVFAVGLIISSVLLLKMCKKGGHSATTRGKDYDKTRRVDC